MSIVKEQDREAVMDSRADAGIATYKDYTFEPMDLDRDWAGIEHLLAIEEWPFIRDDFEVSHEQPRAIAIVVRHQGVVRGFFTAHHFEDIGYMDMIIMDASVRRNVMVLGHLFRRVGKELSQRRFRGEVGHMLPEALLLLRPLGYKPGIEFALMRREAVSTEPGPSIDAMPFTDLDEVIALDTSLFGVSRAQWLTSLMRRPTSRIFSRKDSNGDLAASLCLRERRENSLCLDSCNSRDFAPLKALIDEVITAFPHRRLECFVRKGTDLEAHLIASGFRIPPFFEKIAPLLEARRGDLDSVGLGPFVRSLNWL